MKKNIYIKIIFIMVISMISNLAIAANDDHDHDHGTHDSDSQFYGHLDLRVHYDIITEAEEDDEKFNEAYSHSHLELGARIDEKISINTNIKLEGEAFGHSHGGAGAAAPASDHDSALNVANALSRPPLRRIVRLRSRRTQQLSP